MSFFKNLSPSARAHLFGAFLTLCTAGLVVLGHVPIPAVTTVASAIGEVYAMSAS